MERMVDEQPVERPHILCPTFRPSPGDRREADRHLTLYRVGSIVVDDRRELCLIKHISAGGMMIRCYCAIYSAQPCH